MKKLLYQTYLQTVRNSCGSQMFRNLYIENAVGEVTDVLENGNLSCAMFVSSILAMFNKIDARHGTVSGTVTALIKAGWTEMPVELIEPGDVLIWEQGTSASASDDVYRQGHSHIGFYVGDSLAVSNNSENGFPIIHSHNYHGTRKIVQAFRTTWPILEVEPTPSS